MSATLVIAGQNVSSQTFYDVNVTCGREDVSSQPDGSVLNATLRDWHGAGAVGDPVTLVSAYGGLLFNGYITDLNAEYVVDADEWRTTLTATGPLAALGHALAGAMDYPAETDSRRIARVLDETGFPHAVNPSLEGPVLIARLTEEASAADLARVAADSGLGVLWEDPSDIETPIHYTPQRYRTWGAFELGWSELPDAAWRDMGALKWSELNSDNLGAAGRPPIVRVNPHTAFAEVSFIQTVSDYARAHTVTYGEPPAEIVERAGMPESSGTPIASTDGVRYELGASYRFHELRAAEITGLRFYRPAGYPATTTAHDVKLWDANGTLLAWVLTEDEQDDAWAVAMLETPVRIVPGELYTVTYDAADTYFTFHPLAPVSADETLCQCMGSVLTVWDGSGFPPPGAPADTQNYYADLLWHLLDERPTLTVGDKNPHGEHDTELAEQSDAQHYGELRLRQTQTPRWRLERFEVRISRMLPSSAGDLIAALQVGTRIELRLPSSSPVGDKWQGFLEGWTHSLIPYEDGSADHRLSLQVSDRSLTEPGASWRNIGGQSWGEVDPALTWREAVSFD